jgi:hypothetical protein
LVLSGRLSTRRRPPFGQPRHEVVEVTLLGQSDRFIAFLHRRADEPGGTPLDEVRKKRD